MDGKKKSISLKNARKLAEMYLVQMETAKKDLVDTISNKLLKHRDLEKMADLKKSDVPNLIEAIINEWPELVERGKKMREAKRKGTSTKKDDVVEKGTTNGNDDDNEDIMETVKRYYKESCEKDKEALENDSSNQDGTSENKSINENGASESKTEIQNGTSENKAVNENGTSENKTENENGASENRVTDQESVQYSFQNGFQKNNGK